MSFTSLSAVVIVLMALIIFKYAVSGYKKGLTHAFSGLGATLISVFFGALLSIWLVNRFADPILDEMKLYLYYYDLADFLMGYELVLDLVIKMIFTLIAFLPVFYILRLLTLFVVSIVLRKLCPTTVKSSSSYYKEGEEFYLKKNKALAAAVGAVGGFFVSIVCLMPLSGGMRAAASIVDFADNLEKWMSRDVEEETLAEEDFDMEEDEEEDDEDDEVFRSIRYFADDYMLWAVGGLGGDMLFDFATTVGGIGDQTSLYAELEVLSEVNFRDVEHLITMVSNGEKSSYTLRKMISGVEKSKVMRLIFVETIRGASEAWLNDESYFGIFRPSFSEYSSVDTVINELLYVCSSTDADSVVLDLTTLVNVSTIFNDYRQMIRDGDYDVLISVMVENGLISEIRKELGNNPRMVTVLASVEDMIMTVLAEEINDFEKYTDIDREELYEGIANILSSTSDKTGYTRVSAVMESIKESFTDFDMYVPDELNEEIANQLIEGIESGLGDVSTDDVREFFEEYINSGGTVPVN